MPRSPLPPPEHQALPPEVRQIYVEVDRKCGTFIFPQMHELGAGDVVAELAARGGALAERAAAGEHETLEADYRQLLNDAQGALRAARAREVADAADRQRAAGVRSQLAARVADAKGRLPAARWARLQQQLAALAEGADGIAAQLEVITRALQGIDQQQRTRQDREAARLASQAESVVRPRPAESARSRRARREQAALLAGMGTAAPAPPSRPRPPRGGEGGGGRPGPVPEASEQPTPDAPAGVPVGG